MRKEKLYLGAGDINIIDVISQKNQIILFNNLLAQKKSSVAFDVFENPETSHLLSRIIKVSSQASENIDGIIFFSLMQFSYDKKFKIDLLHEFSKNFKLIFFRENLFIKSYKDFLLNKKKLQLFKDNNLSILEKFKSLA